MAYHVETGHEEVGENWTLCCHVSGKLPPLSIILDAHNLTLETGYGHRNRVSCPNALEIPRQSQRYLVLLAARHVGYLVLLRGCRHYHRAMRAGAANSAQRCPHYASVKAAGIFDGGS